MLYSPLHGTLSLLMTWLMLYFEVYIDASPFSRSMDSFKHDGLVSAIRACVAAY